MNEVGNQALICADAVPGFRPVRISAMRRVGFVYFVTDGDTIKIGFSRAPTNRIKELSAPSGLKLTMIAFFPGYMDEEHTLHRLFAEYLVSGAEWFRADQVLIEFILNLTKMREPLYSKLISLTDVIHGNHTKKIAAPTTAAGFETWATRECWRWRWPSGLQVQAAYAGEEYKKLAHARPGSIDAFAAAYEAWSGVSIRGG